MGVKLIDESILGDIADAIRGRSGLEKKIHPQDMGNELKNIYRSVDPEIRIGGALIRSSDNIYDVNFANNTLDMFPVVDDSVLKMNFYNCQNLRGAPVCGKNVINMDNAYCKCHWLSGQPVCGPNVVNMRNAYYSCSYYLIGQPVCGPNVIDFSEAYAYCGNLSGQPVCGKNVTNMHGTYINCYNLIGQSVCGPNVVDFSEAYFYCNNISGQPVCGPNVVNMQRTYYTCNNLIGQPVCGPNVIDFSEAYAFCRSLSGQPVCGKNVTNMCNTYYACDKITGSPVCGPNVVNMAYSYSLCQNLRGSSVYGPNIEDITRAYLYCRNLTGFSVYGEHLAAIAYAARDCVNVKNVFIDCYETKNIASGAYTYNCFDFNKTNWEGVHIFVTPDENGDILLTNVGNLAEVRVFNSHISFSRNDSALTGHPYVVVPKMTSDGNIINYNYSLKWDSESWDIVANKDTVIEKGYYWQMLYDGVAVNNSYMIIVSNCVEV